MENDERQLTPEAKAAVRTYVGFLIGIPAIVAAVLMFFLGYFVKDVAEERAFNEAFKALSARYTDLLTQMAQDRELVRSARTAIDAERTKIEDIRKGLESVHVLATATSNIEQVAAAVRNHPDFKAQFGDVVRYGDELALESERHPNFHLHAYTGRNVTVEANALTSPFVRWTIERVPPK